MVRALDLCIIVEIWLTSPPPSLSTQFMNEPLIKSSLCISALVLAWPWSFWPYKPYGNLAFIRLLQKIAIITPSKHRLFSTSFWSNHSIQQPSQRPYFHRSAWILTQLLRDAFWKYDCHFYMKAFTKSHHQCGGRGKGKYVKSITSHLWDGILQRFTPP